MMPWWITELVYNIHSNLSSLLSCFVELESLKLHPTHRHSWNWDSLHARGSTIRSTMLDAEQGHE